MKKESARTSAERALERLLEISTQNECKLAVGYAALKDVLRYVMSAVRHEHAKPGVCFSDCRRCAAEKAMGVYKQ